jgi:outer membrane protein assembly factor BamB
VIAGDLFIFNADAAQDPSIIALEKATGKLRWKVKREAEAKRKFSFSTPLLIDVGGVKQLITPGSGVVQALDPATGRELWRVNFDQGYSVVPRPVFADGMLYVCTGYDKPGLLAIRVDATSQGDVTQSHLAWRLDKFVPHNPSVIVVGKELYSVADNGVLSCLDAKTGKVHYQERCTGPSSSSILHADGKLYLLDERGQGVVVQTGTRFKVLATNDLDERALASYAVVENDLLVRTAEHLYRFGERK